MKKSYKIFRFTYEGEDKENLKKGMPMCLMFDREHIKKIYHAYRIYTMTHYIDKNGNPVDVSFIKFIRDNINFTKFKGRPMM
jgi:hypothetical protein